MLPQNGILKPVSPDSTTIIDWGNEELAARLYEIERIPGQERWLTENFEVAV